MRHLKTQEGTTRHIKIFMNNLAKLLTKIGLISLLSVLPLAAQVGNGVKFTTPFPFYVGDTKMPSGSYTLTQPDDLNFQIAIIRGADGKHNAAFSVNPTENPQTPNSSKVVFQRYGDNLYFNRVIVQGYETGMVALKTKAEKKAALMATAVEERSVVAYGR
jgi:hypothetical protein